MAQTDEKVLQLFEVVRKKKAEIAKAEKPQWKTNCSFGYDQDVNSRSNIQVISDVTKLVGMLAFLYEKKKAWDDAAKDLSVDMPFVWFGFSVEDWRSDFQTRINKILITKKKAELELLEGKLDKLMSPEMKTQLELEAISKELGV